MQASLLVLAGRWGNDPVHSYPLDPAAQTLAAWEAWPVPASFAPPLINIVISTSIQSCTLGESWSYTWGARA